MRRLLASLAFTVVVASAFFAPSVAVFAQSPTEYAPLTAIPYLTAPEDGKATVNPVHLVKNIYGVSIAIGAVIAVAMIIWAGLEYATIEAFGSKSDAKERWTHAIYGLLLLLSAYVILRTINVDLVNMNLDLSKPLKGEAVSGDALAKLYERANQAAASLQSARQRQEATQKSYNDLLKQKEDFLKTIGEETDVAKKTELYKQLGEVEKSILAAKVSLDSSAGAVAKEGAMLAASQLSAQTTSDAAKAISRERIGGEVTMSPEEALRQISVAKSIALGKFDEYAASLGDEKSADTQKKLDLERSAMVNMADQSAALVRASFTLNSSNIGINDKIGPLNTALNIINAGANIPLSNTNPQLSQELIAKTNDSRARLLEIANAKCGGKAAIGERVTCLN